MVEASLTMVFIAILFGALSQTTDKDKHSFLRLFYMLLMFLFLFTTLWVLQFEATEILGVSEISSVVLTIIQVLTWSFALIVLYLFITLMRNTLGKAGTKEDLEELTP